MRSSWRLGAFAILVSLLAGCSGSPRVPVQDDRLRAALIDAVKHADVGAKIDLQDPLGTSWDRLVLLPPYAVNADAREVLGFEFDVEASPTSVQDDGTVFVLANRTNLVAWFVVPWNDADTSFVKAPMVVRVEHAQFKVGVDTDGYRTLRPITVDS